MAYRNGQRLPLDESGAGGSEGSGPTLRLSVNPRARRLSVRIDARAGEAVVIAPTERGLSQAVAFARSKAVWISERLAVRPKSRPLEPGQVISLRGRPVRLEAVPGAGAARLVENGTIIRSGGEGEAYARRVENLLKREARDTLLAVSYTHLRAHETKAKLVCRLLLDKKNSLMPP